MPKRKCVKSNRPLQHRSGVTRFKQVENQSRNNALRKITSCQCMLRTEILLDCVYGLRHPTISYTNFCEPNKNPTM